uniref:Uncharacterized protein n=1 Tax=Plectus sambesii TaxID=2011161 RepID=A0A914VHC7_9BILA
MKFISGFLIIVILIGFMSRIDCISLVPSSTPCDQRRGSEECKSGLNHCAYCGPLAPMDRADEIPCVDFDRCPQN